MNDAAVLPEITLADASMGAASALPSTAEDDPRRARIERQLEVLSELTDIGLEVARALERQAKDSGPNDDVQSLSRAYARTARAVRLTIMLQSKLIEALQRIDIRAEVLAVSEAARDAARRCDPEYVHKARVENIVERVAREACDGDEDRLDRLMTEACERLDDRDIYGAVLDRPVGELVALICRDLGLSPDWGRLAEEAWAQEEVSNGMGGASWADSPAQVSARPQAEEDAALFPHYDAHKRIRPPTVSRRPILDPGEPGDIWDG
ncbi:MAG: hypothetical protein ACXWK7_01570 [Caulobacteraceae bacterium]